MSIHRVLLSLIAGISFLSLFTSVAQAYEVIAVNNSGKILGTVTFAGTPPTPRKLEISKDVGVCGQTEKFDESLVVGPQSGLKNVVVSITNIQKGKPLGAGGTLDQKGCVYIPRVVLSPAGTDLRILNSDGILHNIHTHSSANPPVNKPQPKFKPEMKEAFAHPETIKLTCDAHAWMSGWLVVHDHPYYAVTDADGSFTLTDVPPGDYDLKFWHETLGEMTQKVTVKANDGSEVSVTMGKQEAVASQ